MLYANYAADDLPAPGSPFQSQEFGSSRGPIHAANRRQHLLNQQGQGTPVRTGRPFGGLVQDIRLAGWRAGGTSIFPFPLFPFFQSQAALVVPVGFCRLLPRSPFPVARLDSAHLLRQPVQHHHVRRGHGPSTFLTLSSLLSPSPSLFHLPSPFLPLSPPLLYSSFLPFSSLLPLLSPHFPHLPSAFPRSIQSAIPSTLFFHFPPFLFRNAPFTIRWPPLRISFPAPFLASFLASSPANPSTSCPPPGQHSFSRKSSSTFARKIIITIFSLPIFPSFHSLLFSTNHWEFLPFRFYVGAWMV